MCIWCEAKTRDANKESKYWAGKGRADGFDDDHDDDDESVVSLNTEQWMQIQYVYYDFTFELRSKLIWKYFVFI